MRERYVLSISNQKSGSNFFNAICSLAIAGSKVKALTHSLMISPPKRPIRSRHRTINIKVPQRLRQRNTRQRRIIRKVAQTSNLIYTEAGEVIRSGIGMAIIFVESQQRSRRG